MRYPIILEPTKEADNPNWYYAHISALDLTTHGFSLDGAIEAAQDLAAGWLDELKRQGTPIPVEQQSITLVTIKNLNSDSLSLAEKIYTWTANNLKKFKGYYSF